MDREVLSTDVFKKRIAGRYVLYLADFPKNKQPVHEKENRALELKYGVQGYPTLVLTTADGRLLGQIEYSGAKAETYVENLTLYADFVDGLAQLNKASTDAARSALYPTVIPLANRVSKLSWIAKHVRAYDPKNEKRLLTALTAEQANALQAKDARAALELLNAFEGKFPVTSGTEAQRFYVVKSNCHYQLKQTKQFIAALKKALKAAPESDQSKRIQKYLKGRKK